MPNLDGTGPQGKGPLTGRMRGRCRETEIEKSKPESPESKDIVYGAEYGRRQGNGARGSGRGRK